MSLWSTSPSQILKKGYCRLFHPHPDRIFTGERCAVVHLAAEGHRNINKLSVGLEYIQAGTGSVVQFSECPPKYGMQMIIAPRR